MIRPLARSEMRRNAPVLVIFMGILTLYTAILTSMYDPARASALEAFKQAMPQVFDAVGMAGNTSSLVGFINANLFGFIYKIFPLIFIYFLTQRLVIRYIDRGTLATFLATPHPRRAIILNQIAVFLANVLILVAYVVVLTLLVTRHQFGADSLDMAAYLRLACGWLALLLCEAGICVFFACVFSEGGKALGAGVGLTVAFLLCQMIAQAGERFEALRFATIFTLFDQEGLLTGSGSAWLAVGGLTTIGVCLFSAGAVVFCRRNFSL